jgi:hypothetical protein
MGAMQIRIENPDAHTALETAFANAGCPMLPEGDTFEVVHPDPDELAFFLRAWALTHPDVRLEVV